MTHSRALHIAALALVLVMPVSSSAMHPILVYSGRLCLESNELVVRITLDEHSLYHEISGEDDAVRSDRMAEELSRSLVLLDQHGKRIEPRTVSVVPGSQCEIRYTLADSVRLVVFQYRVSRDSPVVHRQIQLTPLDGQGESLGLLRLSTGGNIEVIAIENSASDQRILRREDDWVESFQVPHIATRVENRELVVEVNMPAPLLSTWFSMTRQSIDVLTAEDVDDLRRELQSWFDRQLLITRKGENTLSTSTQLSMQMLTQDLSTNREAESACFWISSVKFVARYPIPQATPGIDLTWRGFNGAVLQAIVEVDIGESKHTLIRLTPSTPSWRITP